MSTGLASDEVAEDYKNSLEDLTGNDKFQISNLTVIAKENTEHAMAISRVLENHIRTTPPAQKLPALYVVDSVVKNVGTPYTLFLGRNLYQTFMNAYTLVDSQTRKKLDEMLKTWKEPVPGSLDTRPVFPVEITRSIENALIKARTAALQNQQARSQHDILGRNRGVTTPPTSTTWRNTPTPPQIPPRLTQSANQNIPQQYPSNGHQHYPSAQPVQPYGQPFQESIDLSALHRDIESLIATARADFAINPLDPSIQQRLKALLDLQNILQQQKLPQDQLKLIRDQVSQLSPQSPQAQPPPRVVPTPPIPQAAQSIQNHTPQPNLQALLNPATIAELIKATTNQQSRTPPPPPVVPHIPPFLQPQATSTPPPPAPSTAPTLTENPLIASLRARGLLPPPTSSAPPTPPNLPFILPGQAGYTPPAVISQLSNPSEVKINIQMTSASIRIPRPNLISTLYEEKPNRCGTCGRRFHSDDQGKEKKARHLDWHFKTNQRMTEASKRGQSRSWYLGEREWIKSREYDDDTGGQTGEGATSTNGSATDAAAAGAKKSSQKPWIHAPNDAALRNAPCPICQEKFESTWSEEAQDWIWHDASKVGSRVYHASCYSEVTRDGTATGQGTPVGRTGTPDSVLGKRKAEEPESVTTSVRIKTEPAS
ncbi:hypothetical protein RJZ56_007650 [Blastomyces dermatitidis]|uniref:mRNA cleavage factor complex component Pcf11 n=3 Tax=Blastomyces TaxID=229219 RepID=A0A179USL1_BLAGS|nr:mRNA cleavage factor complex component Pcf11 [Blastomyces gilchristii SLH14081]XP_045277281.1 mRNA cleavage factor complex component Pcf11 [Blastomyces dermatitidis ER-3]EEQ90576.1 mRNA cleavage factor complex component Pcf11 [Blastomyces dermatitidis ER-3]EGE81506.1 mRNA cleavage factor complex component Pcf11 [Blastomyces dermatitidis ATCC 18188]OAT11086.1 mRNA cleavage factor complex component Pcf11 [Blastomyces gilchristii SLH14081]